jgi:hypothetical protein
MVMLQDLKEWAGVVESALKSLGILAAGAWAYFHYFRGRTYRPRLELKADAELLHRGSDRYVLVNLAIANRGLSKVPIEQVGTGLRIRAHRQKIESFETDKLETTSIFTAHEWIEPGEFIEEERLVRIPSGDWLAIRLEFRLVSRGKSWEITRTCPIELEKVNSRHKQLEER